ncbi:serine/threonine-protein kinase [Arthrobacter tumbae]|uniref:serine/threonine-protein kinase n=1 Tax=Arthrobacter tumbae TaxID=163874 RepID=UPI001956B594|nr:serine/threonine-protein kinase [Arthrobacter tumbae]MBM7782595.1 hypothetical protein [Arthrobacter tumbae]
MNQETLASGRYVLDRVIGAGGMADVYRARDTRLHRDVAVKMFRPGSAEGVARGSGEARMLAALHHPGLVRVLDMDAESGRLEPSYLVMEYVKGPDLGAVLRDGALSIESTTTAARDIARTLEYIHGQGIVHRDIKPSNVLTRYGAATSGLFSFLLTDFGIARFFESSRVTATGSLIGTATYFSPEQARGDRVGTPTDVYALGLLLIECLIGEPAFPGTGLESVLARLSRPPAIPESFGAGWHQLLTKMTLDNPLERPTAAEVVRLLDAIDVPSTEAGIPAGPGTEQTTTTAQPSTATLAGAVAGPATVVAAAADTSPAVAPAAAAPVATAASTAVGAPAAAASPASDPSAATAPWSTPRIPAERPSGQLTLEALDMETASHPEPPRRRAAAKVRLRARALAAVVVLVGLTFAVLLIVFDLNAGPGPTPLPTVPGVTGAMLDSLYESVQP